MGTIIAAFARLDHHDILVEGLSIITVELDPDRPGLLRSAASAIHTRATILGAVLFYT